MTKEKKLSLEKYKTDLTDKLKSGFVGAKHTNHPESYKNFLKNELRLVTAKLEEEKLANQGK